MNESNRLGGGDSSDLIAVSERIARKERETGFASLTDAEQVFHAVWWFEAELNNGGFHQFFFNDTGDYTVETIAALERIGASRYASIVRRACALFPNEMPSADRNKRQEQLLAITEENGKAFEELDAAFYQYPDKIGDLLSKFWAAHGG